MIDFNALIGPFPYRQIPHPEPAVLDRVLEREKLSGAWVGHLPTAFHRDPSYGNAELFEALESHSRLNPVPTVRPDWPDWETQLDFAKSKEAPAVRAYPQHWGLGPGDA